MKEKLLRNKEVCERLGVSNYHRLQMIEQGFLEKPVCFGGAHPRHTEQQVLRAQKRLAETATNLTYSTYSGKSLLSEKESRLITENAHRIRTRFY